MDQSATFNHPTLGCNASGCYLLLPIFLLHESGNAKKKNICLMIISDISVHDWLPSGNLTYIAIEICHRNS